MIQILRVLTIEINLAKDNNQRGLHTTSILFHWSCRLLRTILAHPPHSSSITFSICNDFDKEEENIARRAHLVKVNVLCNVAFLLQLETDSAVHFIVQVELVMLPGRIFETRECPSHKPLTSNNSGLMLMMSLKNLIFIRTSSSKASVGSSCQSGLKRPKLT